MKQEYTHPFCQAVQEVFKLMLNLEVMHCPVDNQAAGASGKEVAVSIELTGDVAGSIRFRFPEKITLEIVKLMCGMEMEQLDTFVTSAIGEMSNIISGNAVSHLAAANYRCDILPPKIEIAESGTFSGEPGQSIPLQTSVGTITMNMLLTGK